MTSGLFRFSATQFLLALILVLVANPFLAELRRGEVIVSVSMTLVSFRPSWRSEEAAGC